MKIFIIDIFNGIDSARIGRPGKRGITSHTYNLSTRQYAIIMMSYHSAILQSLMQTNFLFALVAKDRGLEVVRQDG